MIMKFNMLSRNSIKHSETVAMATKKVQKRLPWQHAYVLQFMT